MHYDFLIVGAGLYGAVFAQQMKEYGKRCIVIDKRPHIAGNVYSERIEGIDVHRYGPHIFHTSSESIWQYANRFTKFVQYAHKVKARHQDKIYSMPINLQTLYEVFGVSTPEDAQREVEASKLLIDRPRNLEEHCLSVIGQRLYDLFIREYTHKQWGRDPKELPADIIKRLPVRFNFDDRWHQSTYSGIPAQGYTQWVENTLDGIQVETGVDFFSIDWTKYAHHLIFTGRIDQYFGCSLGELEYRTLRFEHRTLNGDYQGIAQINYTDATPCTRTVEHKHFTFKQHEKTVVTWEYPEAWHEEATPYYPINDDRNAELLLSYKALKPTNVTFGGRLGAYRYYDMHQVIGAAIHDAENKR
jgi:UDP-galactopyranose mutase